MSIKSNQTVVSSLVSRQCDVPGFVRNNRCVGNGGSPRHDFIVLEGYPAEPVLVRVENVAPVQRTPQVNTAVAAIIDVGGGAATTGDVLRFKYAVLEHGYDGQALVGSVVFQDKVIAILASVIDHETGVVVQLKPQLQSVSTLSLLTIIVRLVDVVQKFFGTEVAQHNNPVGKVNDIVDVGNGR